jgi:hypothetical protein
MHVKLEYILVFMWLARLIYWCNKNGVIITSLGVGGPMGHEMGLLLYRVQVACLGG